MSDEHVIRMSAPAVEWTDALPVGNGRIGAMVFGRPTCERLQINDTTCWTGDPSSRPVSPLTDDPPARVTEARGALADGDLSRAHGAVRALQSGQSADYQPLVDLWVDAADTTSGDAAAVHAADAPAMPAAAADADADADTAIGSERWLDLREGIAHSTWDDDGGRVRQEVYASAPDGVLVLERSSDVPRCVAITLSSPHPWAEPPLAGARGSAPATLSAVVRMPPYAAVSTSAVVHLAVVTDGELTSSGAMLSVTGARRLRIVLATATDHLPGGRELHGDTMRLRGEARRTAAAAITRNLRERHLAAHRTFMDRVTLRLGGGAQPDPRPLQDRLIDHARGRGDPGLAALAFTFGRYLLLASSRPGGLPANLQGLWNEQLQPPWHSAYTLNINLPMNYWGALLGGLPESHEPLLDWLCVLAEQGQVAAERLYAMPGWVAHHNSDPWGFAFPVGDGTENPCWAFWPMAGAWLVRHIADHWHYTGDADLLRRTWPVLEGAARFLLAWLVPRPDGTLGTSPATSPENTYLSGGQAWSVTETTTADLAIARDLLRHVGDLAPAAQQAGVAVDDALVRAAATARSRLPREHVLRDGRLAEWPADYADAEPKHRHTTHLFGLYPGTEITPEDTPALAAAAARTLDARGGHSTGWALAWRVALRARLHDGAAVEALVRAFLHPVDATPGQVAAPTDGSHVGGVYRTLLCAHPPFQIDGNLGLVAGIAEALIQAHRLGADGVRQVHLLPALPPSWPRGELTGVRLPGQITASLAWRDGRLHAAELTSAVDTTVDVRIGADVIRARLRAQRSYAITS